MKQKDQTFLITTGALTALGLPFAIAYPRTLLEKLLCIALLVALAACIAAAIEALRRNKP
jgi:hypothetical protein